MQWNSTYPGTGGYQSGAVCGQDPKYVTVSLIAITLSVMTEYTNENREKVWTLIKILYRIINDYLCAMFMSSPEQNAQAVLRITFINLTSSI